eukprot:2776439-Pyramimonas_sp.AAC.1
MSRFALSRVGRGNICFFCLSMPLRFDRRANGEEFRFSHQSPPAKPGPPVDYDEVQWRRPSWNPASPPALQAAALQHCLVQ